VENATYPVCDSRQLFDLATTVFVSLIGQGRRPRLSAVRIAFMLLFKFFFVLRQDLQSRDYQRMNELRVHAFGSESTGRGTTNTATSGGRSKFGASVKSGTLSKLAAENLGSALDIEAAEIHRLWKV